MTEKILNCFINLVLIYLLLCVSTMLLIFGIALYEVSTNSEDVIKRTEENSRWMKERYNNVER